MDAFRALSDRVAAHPNWCALLLGVIAACGFQPLALWPLTIIAVAGLVALAAKAATWKKAALAGWLFGVGHFALGNNWIATAFTYQAEMPAWLGWIAVILLSLFLAVYPALATTGAWLIRRYGSKDAGSGGIAFGLAFAGCWILSEWVRSWLFTGFAWNPLGMILLGGFDTQGVALVAPWIGTYGLSGLAVILSVLLLALVQAIMAGPMRRRLLAGTAGIAAACALIAIMVLPASYLPPQTGGIAYTLVQPDVRQENLDNPALFETHFLKTARLTVPRKAGQQRVVFWPESGIPDYLRDGYPKYLYRQMTYAGDPALARQRIGKVIGLHGLLLTGTVDLVMHKGDDIAARNSVTAIDGRGSIVASYS
ncbi:MAG: apolipoprotein N-acyltransferase, partial [Novosphingobium sp.]|nr:apolipoprotein N-acyltransferase [Novosphingobium sp.]